MSGSGDFEGFTTKEMLVMISGKIDKLTDCTSALTTQAERNKDRIDSHDGNLNRHEGLIKEVDDKLDKFKEQ